MSSGQRVGVVGEESVLPTTRWSTCTRTSASYIEDRRRNPRADVLTALATSTYPDGSLPDCRRSCGWRRSCSARARTPRHACSALRRILAENKDMQASCVRTRVGCLTSWRKCCGWKARP